MGRKGETSWDEVDALELLAESPFAMMPVTDPAAGETCIKFDQWDPIILRRVVIWDFGGVGAVECHVAQEGRPFGVSCFHIEPLSSTDKILPDLLISFPTSLLRASSHVLGSRLASFRAR